MKIVVFGATGRVGACVVEQALQAGHDVTAFVRDRRRFKPSAGQGSDREATVVEGDVLDPATVSSALAPGFDAVVCAIGAPALKPSALVTGGVRAIVAGMKSRGIGRFLGVSGTAEMEKQTFLGKMTTALLKVTPVGHAIRDHDRAFEEVKNCGLQWMLAGCPFIKDGPRRGAYRTSLVYPGGWKVIHPPDVADLLVRELAEARFTGNVVGIWY